MKRVDSTKTPFAIYKGTGSKNDLVADKEWTEMAVKYLGSPDPADRMARRISEMSPERQGEVKQALLEHWRTMDIEQRIFNREITPKVTERFLYYPDFVTNSLAL